MNIRFGHLEWRLASAAGALLTAGLLLAPLTAQAADLRTEPSRLTIPPGQTVNDDVYAAGQTVNVEGTVNGSVFAAGNNTNISGVVNGDVFTGGSTTSITGRVTGNVYTAGGTVVVGGSVGKDVFAWGGTVRLQPTASVARDAFVSGGQMELAGSVGRNLNVSGGDATIGGAVAGNVTGSVNHIRIVPGATVGGNLTYTGNTAADIAPGSVTGTVNAALRAPQPGPSFLAISLGWLRTVVGLFVLGLVLVWAAPGFTRRASQSIGGAPWASLGFGVTLLAGVPFAALLIVVLGAFIGGWWLAFGVLALYAFALPVGYVLASLFVASMIAERAARVHLHLVWLLLGGIVVLTLAGRIPYVGPWLTFAAVVFGFGAFVIGLAGRFKKPPATELQPRPLPMAA